MTLAAAFALAIGLALLIAGAEALVRGASRLAAALGVPPLILGLTVVAFGTSAPELAVNIQAAYAGEAPVAVGNVVGSNIFNVLFILGAAALVTPLAVTRQLVRLDVPVLIAVSAIALGLAVDRAIGRVDAVLLVTGLLAYLGALVWVGRRESAAPSPAGEGPATPALRAGAARRAGDCALVAGGLALLVVGARWFVGGAVELAAAMGVSERVIGLTVVAAGTSLPELATSLVAGFRGHRDIAVGNVVGSNLFNLLGVLGLSALIAPAAIAVTPAALALDMPLMVAVAIGCLPVFFTGARIDRWEGAVFVALYVAYTGYLVAGPAGPGPLASATLAFVVPLVVVTAVAVAARGRPLPARTR